MRDFRHFARRLLLGAVTLGNPLTMSAAAPQSPSGASCVSFHEVHSSVTAHEARQTGAPAGYRLYPLPEGFAEREALLREEPVLGHTDVAEVEPIVDPHVQQPVISIRFTAEGTRKFAAFSGNNIGRPLSVVVGEQIISLPIILSQVLGGVVQISGNLTAEDAENLAGQIRSGKCR